ncbi:MAG: M28 family peptidase [Acidobacteria bacterium]|nr:M28 family peptidase [Acidobacteriota bacterium]
MKRITLAILLLSLTAMIFNGDTLAQKKQTKPQQVAAASAAKPESKWAAEYGNVEGITAKQISEYLYFVASDEMEGRDTPSRGLDLTAKFIGLNLSKWGFKPAGTDGTFFQKIPLRRTQVLGEQSSAAVNGQSFKYGEDFYASPAAGEVAGQLVFVGHGLMVKAKNIDYYTGIDVKDKIMVVVDGAPAGVNFNDYRGKVGEDFHRPETYARAKGARGIIVIPSASTMSFWDQRVKSSLNPTRAMPDTGRPMNNVPTIIASEKMVNAILQGEKIDFETIKKQVSEGKLSESFELSPSKTASFKVGSKVETMMTQNVVAVFEGGDPALKDEYVAIGAHYDHVGIGQADSKGDKIFNGADDDGSGTVAVLSIAEALSHGPRPKRSILFVWHCGEEKGLWGSEFVTENPPVPLKQIITQLNIDMIGRSKAAGDTKPANANLSGPNDIYVIGSKMMSTQLGELSESVNKGFLNLGFSYKYDDPNDRERFFYRSDHFNYAKKGIPIIFYFDGVHEDYHRQSDHPDKIDYAKMEKVTRTVFATMWKLANDPSRPKVDKPLPAQLAGF